MEKLSLEGAKVKSSSQLIYLKTVFLNIAQSHVKQVSVHITQDLNLTKCFTSVIIVIMRAIISIILGDMKSFNMDLHVTVLTVTTKMLTENI